MDDNRRSSRMENCVETGGVKRRITRQVIVDVVLWLIVGIPVLYLFLFGTPNHRGFFCDDVSISYPYKPDTLSTNMLLVLGFSTSLATMLIVEILNSVNRKCYETSSPPVNISYIIKCYIVFLVGFNINQLFVEIIKNETGALRPNFLFVCRPQYNSSLCPGYISEYICSSAHTAEAIRQSRQSFPSGHSALTMFIAVYFCALLLLASLVCGFRRVLDHKHHMTDVISGFFIGACCATFVYKTLAERIMTINKQDMTHSSTGPCDNCCSGETSVTDPGNRSP